MGLAKICLIQVVNHIISCLLSNFEGRATLGLFYKNHKDFARVARDRARMARIRVIRAQWRFSAYRVEMIFRAQYFVSEHQLT